MTVYDRRCVIKDLQDVRRELAALKRDAAHFGGLGDAFWAKALAAEIAGEDEDAEMNHAFAEAMYGESVEAQTRRRLALDICRLLEKELTQ